MASPALLPSPDSAKLVRVRLCHPCLAELACMILLHAPASLLPPSCCAAPALPSGRLGTASPVADARRHTIRRAPTEAVPGLAPLLPAAAEATQREPDAPVASSALDSSVRCDARPLPDRGLAAGSTAAAAPACGGQPAAAAAARCRGFGAALARTARGRARSADRAQFTYAPQYGRRRRAS